MVIGTVKKTDGDEIRVTLHHFKGRKFHVRRYFMNHAGIWLPTRQGICLSHKEDIRDLAELCTEGAELFDLPVDEIVKRYGQDSEQDE